MKKLFLTILLLLSSTSLSFAAIAATTVWEVRTTGNALNGGGFNAAQTSAGTDYSQQDAAQLALTDLACASNTTLTSATGGFTAAMVGNLIYIASGTNAAAGYYEITAYSDTNTVTIDRTCAIGGNMTDGVGKVGGASNHPQTIAAVLIAGNTIYVKAGTYQKVGANVYVLNYTTAGTVNAPIKWIGYNSSRTVRPVGTDRPVFDGASSAADVVLVGNNYNLLDSFIIQAGTDKGVDFSSNYNFIGINLRITNNGVQGITRNNASGASTVLFFCEIDTNGGNATYTSNSFGWFFNCYIHDNSGRGIYQRYHSSNKFEAENIVINTIVESNTGHGIKFGDDGGGGLAYVLINNICYNNTGSNNDGVNIGSSNTGANKHPLTVIANLLSLSNASYGFEGNSSIVSFFDFNAYYGNSTGGVNSITPSSGASDVTLDPSLTNPGSADFTLSSSSSPLVGAGVDLSTYTSLTTDFNVNIGVDQGDHVTAGGGGEYSYGFSN